MKAYLFTLSIILCSLSVSYSQINEIGGKLKILDVPQGNNQDDILIRFPDGTVGVRDANSLNRFQILSISNDTIYLSNGGFVKLPASFDGSFSNLIGVPAGLADGDDDTQLTEAEVDAYTSNNGYLTSEVDGSATNELQLLSLSNDTMYLSDGGFVKLPAGFDGAFNSLTGVPTGLADGDDDTQLTEAEVDVYVSNNGYITSEVDGSNTNELQILSLSNDTLYLSDGGFAKLPAAFDGAFSSLTGVPTDLLDGDDDTQLTETEVDVFVSNNGYINSEVDGSITNEIQALSLSNDTIYLENGGFVKVPLTGGLSSEQFLFELHKDLPNGIRRMLEWGYSPVDLIDYGIEYDSLIGMNVNFELYGEPNLIFFIDTLDLHPFDYLAAGYNNYTYRYWACDGNAIPGADGQLLGDGIQNTLDVDNNCPEPPNDHSIFSQVNNAPGINHIASVDEAIMIYDELIVPGYYDDVYGPDERIWLSTEASGANEATHALVIDYTDGSIHEELKSYQTRAMVVTVYY